MHIITGLNTGGAEIMLYNLLSKMNTDLFEAEVVSVTDIGPIGTQIQSLNIHVRALDLTRFYMPNPLVILKLRALLRQSKPDVIQTWMYYADLIGGIAAKIRHKIPVTWGVHSTGLHPEDSKPWTRSIPKICSKVSHILPTRIICCSNDAYQVHAALGYDTSKMMVIPNGFHLDLFVPHQPARLSVRHELGIPEEALVIGLVARFDVLKDHHNFIQAAERLHSHIPNIHFLLCGNNVDKKNDKLIKWIKGTVLEKYFHLLGLRKDIPRLMASLDIFCTSSSFGEAFPMVIGEAMACAVPCVVTDVGDSAFIVGDTGKTVPPKNPSALASAWQQMIEMGSAKRRALGKKARERIQENFDIETIASRYENQYKEMIEENKRKKKSAIVT